MTFQKNSLSNNSARFVSELKTEIFVSQMLKTPVYHELTPNIYPRNPEYTCISEKFPVTHVKVEKF